MLTGADREVVGGICINVQLRRHAGSLQRPVHDDAVLGIADEIGPAMRQKDWRRPGRDTQAGSELILVLGLQIAGIGGDSEVRPAADLIDGVNRLVSALLEACRCRNRQMPAGRETDHADTIGSNAPLLGPAAYQANGTLRILERSAGRFTLGLVGAA